jgi:superfamily II DNA or RNA helicase
LSDTINRKDGTTKVFKMFLGDVLFKMERSKDENVIVRGITFESKDEEYNELEIDFRGQTASSKMLSKICNYNYRSEFIVRVLKDMIEENPKQQIMLIASYKNILAYMYNAITHRNICSVGYYVGRMKESALKESETKQVVLATYAMASEGLDIKTLTTLFMITPMTNIEQSVGRILRQKHEFSPIVVDIIDTHDNFQRQWAKRKSFYKKNNYKIIQTSSSKYDKDASRWRITYEPKNVASSNSDEGIVDDESMDDCSENDDTGNAVTNNTIKSNGTNGDKKITQGVCFLNFKKQT